MKIYFIRNTHDENGNYRDEEYFGRIKMPKPLTVSDDEWYRIIHYNKSLENKEIPFGIDVWEGSGEKYKLTLDEIFERIKLLYKCGAADWTNELPADEKHTDYQILKSLGDMIQMGLVKMVCDGERFNEKFHKMVI